MEDEYSEKLESLLRECIRRGMADPVQVASEISGRLGCECSDEFREKIGSMLSAKLSEKVKLRYDGPSVNGFRTSFENDTELLEQLLHGGW